MQRRDGSRGGNVEDDEEKSSDVSKLEGDVIHKQDTEDELKKDREEDDLLHTLTGNSSKDGEPDEQRPKRRDEVTQDEESELDLRNYLRDDILESVDECLSAWEKRRAPAAEPAPDPFHRCVVCTLPHGRCKHTREWLDGRDRTKISDPLPKDNVDIAMDDISDVLAPAPPVCKRFNANSGDDPSFANLRWETLSAQPADELSGQKVDLSSPCVRSGHTLVLLEGAGNLQEDTRLLVVFGGVSKTNGDDQVGVNPRKSDSKDDIRRGDFRGGGVSQQTLRYHADIRVFNVGLSTWHSPNASGDLPAGRYGHVAVALDKETMWMFGGRLQGGAQAGDTHTLDIRTMRWVKTNAVGDGDLSPPPRFWSAGAKVREKVMLFGGADLINGCIFDDVWTWDIQTRYWTEEIVVGTPPPARYGHVLLACPEAQVLVLGGCCVSIAAEQGLPADHDLLNLRVRVAADMVHRAYELEEAEIAVGAFDIYTELSGSVPTGVPRLLPGVGSRGGEGLSRQRASEKETWRGLSRQQAQLAAAVASRESDTNSREEALREVLYEQAAMTYWAKLRTRHPLKEVDMMFLDTESMIWGTTNQPPAGGEKTRPPGARMNFSAILLGRKVVLWGGCLPTSKRVDMVEGNVHVYDLDRRRWSTPVGATHLEGMRPRMDDAVGQLRRAERALFEATQRALTLGAPGGRTMQVLQAEAVIEVNRWRVRRIEREMRDAIPSPRPRAAHAGCAVGHRVMYFGGWGVEAEKGSLLVLDLEQPHEKERRLDEEFHLRLERERQTRDVVEAESLRRAARQEERRKGLELAREAAETAIMIAEDSRSAIPELTIAPTPRLRCANSTMLWLEWDPPALDAIDQPPDRVLEYTLFMRGGFREWEVGDHVRVEYISRAERRAVASNSTITACSVTDAGSLAGESLLGGGSSLLPSGDESLGGEETVRGTRPNANGESGQLSAGRKPTQTLLPAVITDTTATGGLFDIRWNDGERERGVRRNRIHRPASHPPWTIVYRGHDCRYAVEGMVPESVVEREQDYPYEVSAEFSLQTKGTEVPRNKLSRHSPVVTLGTSFYGQGPLGQGGWVRKTGARAPATVKARLTMAKALDYSLSASEEAEFRSSSSVAHPLHGQFVAAGKGAMFL